MELLMLTFMWREAESAGKVRASNKIACCAQDSRVLGVPQQENSLGCLGIGTKHMHRTLAQRPNVYYYSCGGTSVPSRCTSMPEF